MLKLRWFNCFCVFFLFCFLTKRRWHAQGLTRHFVCLNMFKNSKTRVWCVFVEKIKLIKINIYIYIIPSGKTIWTWHKRILRGRNFSTWCLFNWVSFLFCDQNICISNNNLFIVRLYLKNQLKKKKRRAIVLPSFVTSSVVEIYSNFISICPKLILSLNIKDFISNKSVLCRVLKQRLGVRASAVCHRKAWQQSQCH